MATALGLNATWSQETWERFVLDHLAVESVLVRSGARVIPIDGRVAHIPRTVSDGSAAWVAEGAELPSNAPQGDQLTLTAKKLGDVVVLSRESIEDAPVDELSAVGNALTRAVAVAIDTRAFGVAVATATEPAGLRSYALSSQAGGVVIDSIIRAVGSVEAIGGRANAAFIAPADVTSLRLQKDTAGRPLVQPDLQAGGAETIAGARIFPTPALPTGTALVGDSSQIIVGIRRGISVEGSSDARFTSDSVVVRITARVDFGLNDLRGLIAVVTP